MTAIQKLLSAVVPIVYAELNHLPAVVFAGNARRMQLKQQHWCMKLTCACRNSGATVPIFERAIEMKTAMLYSSSPELGSSEAVLGRAYAKLGDRDRTRRSYQRASARLQVHPELCASLRRDLEELKIDIAKR